MANTLTFNRENLIKSLEAKLDQNEADRKAKQDKIDERNGEAKTRLAALVEQHPEFLVWLNQQVHHQYGASLTSDELEGKMKNFYGPGLVTQWTDESDGPDPDAELKRIIRVFKAASATEVEIEENEPVLNYI